MDSRWHLRCVSMVDDVTRTRRSGRTQNSSNSSPNFSVFATLIGSSSYSSKLLASPGPEQFGMYGASTCQRSPTSTAILSRQRLQQRRIWACSACSAEQGPPQKGGPHKRSGKFLHAGNNGRSPSERTRVMSKKGRQFLRITDT